LINELAYKQYLRVYIHCKHDQVDALHKIGTYVIVHPDSADKGEWNGFLSTVVGVRWANNEYEYAVEGLDFLVWEHELGAAA
jgi:hypothetical protein